MTKTRDGSTGETRSGRGARVDRIGPRDDTAYRLLSDIQAHRIDPRTLKTAQRRALLVVMAHGRQTSTELGAFFGVSANTIRSDLHRLRLELGRETRSWSAEEVVGQLAAYAERCTAIAMKNDDVGLAWTIQRDFARALVQLGLIGRHEDQGGVRITVESLSANAAKAKATLLAALDPRLTGEQVAPT